MTLETLELSQDTRQFQDPEFVNDIRQQMLKFAHMQLRDEHLAEDAVQDALVGAFKSAKSFQGRSAFKTWIFAILKNKIADILRKRQRLIETSSLLSEADDDENASPLFDERGHWHQESKPVVWTDPEASFEEQQFWKVFETCLDRLPAKQARAFMMREFIGLDTSEICTEMVISVSNLHVTLHRARLQLQRCLQLNWLEGEGNA